MPVNTNIYLEIKAELDARHATLVAVSKFQPAAAIEELYAIGQRDFGENFVQELLMKQDLLPKDIRWHFIGHLQSNKVKYIAPFIHLIHGVDSEKLLAEIDKQAAKLNRRIDCLLQIFIADEATKFGFSEAELDQLDLAKYPHVNIIGLMGMASFTEDKAQVTNEFSGLKELYDHRAPSYKFLSMGMSGDYKIALDKGSNMVRIGSLLFGNRPK